MSSPSSFGNTPEASKSGLRRKDSKHALTTCHGLTSNGKACRRPLAAKDSLSSPRYTIKGTLVVPHRDQDPAVFCCWQHKDQADLLKASSNFKSVDVKERTSLETVFRNLGLEEVEEEDEQDQPSPSKYANRVSPQPRQPVQRESRRRQSNTSRPIRGDLPDSLRQHDPEPDSGLDEGTKPSRRRPYKSKAPPNSDSSGIMGSLISCFVPTDLENEPRVRPRTNEHRPRPDRSPITPKARSSPHHERRSSNQSVNKTSNRSPLSPKVQADQRRDSLSPQKPPKMKLYQDLSLSPPQAPSYHRTPVSQPNIRRPLVKRKPLNIRAKSAPEATKMSQEWMPDVPPNPTDAIRIAYAKLLTSMSVRPTKADDSGYIYMFWQSDLEQTVDEEDAAASIVGAPSYSEADSERILQRRFFRKTSVSASPAAEQRTLFLKIGRAENVHRRMTQWHKQCRYNISLLRYYPMESKGDASKVPYVGKVERLVHLHLEMLGMRVSRPCRCGTEHKEWFEVDGTTKGVREVDEIIRQWVRWSIWKYGDVRL